MKPKKRGRKSATQVSPREPKIEPDDDDVFEDIDRQPKLKPKLKTVKKEPPSSQTTNTCQLTKYTRSRAAHSKAQALLATNNSKSDNTKKHVDKNYKMSTRNSSTSNGESVDLIESEVCIIMNFGLFSVFFSLLWLDGMIFLSVIWVYFCRVMMTLNWT